MLIQIALFLLGLFVGFFLWSTIVGTLFATIPISLEAKRLGQIKSVRWLSAVTGFFVNVVIVVVMFIYTPIAFYASLFGLFKMLLIIPTLRQEAVNNLRRDYKITAASGTSDDVKAASEI